MWDRFLEIHLSSSRGRFAKSFKIPRVLLIFFISIIGLLFIFLLISSILFFSQKSPEVSNIQSSNNYQSINHYVENKNTSIIKNELINFINPISSNPFYISKKFDQKYHQGIDIVSKKGDKIHASATGTVMHSGYDDIYGKIIILVHKNNFYTFYGHLDSIFVKRLDFVSENDIIGLVGETGEATGPHLHFKIWNELSGFKNPMLLIEELEERDVTE